MNRYIGEVQNEYDGPGKINESSIGGKGSDADDLPNELAAIRRRRSVILNRRNSSKGSINPLYGIGVVFYLDNYGIIQGVLTWGLPFTDGPELKSDLIQFITHLVSTNAGISVLDLEHNHQTINIALGKASQKVVHIAMKKQEYRTPTMTRTWHNLDGSIEDFSMPLYRYTEVASLKNKTVNILKRQEGDKLGVLGSGLYTRDDLVIEKPQEENEYIPSNVPLTTYPITVHLTHSEEMYGNKAVSIDSIKDMNVFLAVQRAWGYNENRARPRHEDFLWLRPGDEQRKTSFKAQRDDAYRRVMFGHRME